MIQLSSHTILILYADTTTEPMETEQIRNRIFRACIAAGETDSWIADDLSLAVEFALLSKEQRMIRAEELDQLILATLEDAGYSSVATEFQRIARSAPPEFLPVSEESVQLVLNHNLALEPAKFERVSSRVLKSLELLGMESASRGLILELARQFRDTDFSAPALSVPDNSQNRELYSVVLRQEDLETKCSEAVQSLLRSKTLRISHVSRLFSVLRIELSLTAFSELHGLEKPVTELSFWSTSYSLIRAINELCRLADEICLEYGETGCSPLPLSLTVRDAVSFAQNYMNCPEKNALDCVNGLLVAFTASLERQPFKVLLK